jgi:hypothetical protein
MQTTTEQLVVIYANRLRTGPPLKDAEVLWLRMFPISQELYHWPVCAALPHPFLILSCILRQYLVQFFPGTLVDTKIWYNYEKLCEKDWEDEFAIFSLIDYALSAGFIHEYDDDDNKDDGCLFFNHASLPL